MKPLRLGQIAGFEINIDWSWLIVFFLVVYSLSAFYFPLAYPGMSASTNWTIGFTAALLLFASVLAHEIMHSVVARHYGLEIRGITLFIFGGMSQTASEPDSPKVEFYMSIAGPITSFVIAGVFYAFTYVGNTSAWPIPLVAIAGYLAMINFILGLFNLVPGFPLDGGRVLRSIIWKSTNSLITATKYASYVGQGFGYLLIGFGALNIFSGAFIGGMWLIFIGWFLTSAAKSSYQQVLLKEALSGVGVESIMETEIKSVPPETLINDFVHDYLMRQEYASYPVIDHEKVEGIVGVSEVRSVPREHWTDTTVGSITHPVDGEIKVSKNDDAWDALVKLSAEEGGQLLVMDNDTLEGTINQEDILRVVRTKMRLGM